MRKQTPSLEQAMQVEYKLTQSWEQQRVCRFSSMDVAPAWGNAVALGLPEPLDTLPLRTAGLLCKAGQPLPV